MSDTKTTETVNTEVDFTDMDIEKTFSELAEGSWSIESKKEYTLEEKKKLIKNNIISCRKYSAEIAEYMETEEYKKGYEEIKTFYEEKGEEINSEEVYRLRCGQRMISITHTDDEKIALGIKGMLEELHRLEMCEKYLPKGEFIKGTEYIFFSMENATFACRNILVPTKEFTDTYPKVLEMLRRNSTEEKVDVRGFTHHTLVTYYKGINLDENGCGFYEAEPTEFNEFVGGMMTFAECDSHFGVRYGYIDETSDMDRDRKWYIKSICNGYGYFNPDLEDTTLIGAAYANGCSVTETFMFIETREGRDEKNYMYDTPAEMVDAIVKGEF